MNAKIKFIAAIAALQLVAPAVFAQKALPVPGSSYQITGRVVQADRRSIVIRSRGPNAGDFVLMRRDDTRYWAPVRVGDVMTFTYNMMVIDVALAAPEHVQRVVPIYPVPPRYR